MAHRNFSEVNDENNACDDKNENETWTIIMILEDM